MAFTHSKKARLWIDNLELTSYFNEFNMAGKAGIAETTVFGLGAKTYIGGLQEGVISGKGYFGSATTDTVDAELTAALGRQTNMVVLFSPTGATAAGTRVVASEGAETDYSVSAPVSGVVATSFSAQADSGLSTGVIYYDPTTAAIVTATSVNGTGVNDYGFTDTPTDTVAVASNGLVLSTLVGAQPVSVNTNPITQGFATSGYFVVVASGGQALIAYNGLSTTQFLNCTLITGTGAWTLATNAALASPFLTSTGFVFIANVLTLTGTGSPTVAITMQHSDDNSTWSTLATFANITAAGGYNVVVPVNTVILRFVRAQIVTTGTTISTTLAIAGARQ